MKASELIKELQKIIKDEGDLEIKADLDTHSCDYKIVDEIRAVHYEYEKPFILLE